MTRLWKFPSKTIRCQRYLLPSPNSYPSLNIPTQRDTPLCWGKTNQQQRMGVATRAEVSPTQYTWASQHLCMCGTENKCLRFLKPHEEGNPGKGEILGGVGRRLAGLLNSSELGRTQHLKSMKERKENQQKILSQNHVTDVQVSGTSQKFYKRLWKN